MTIKNNYWFTMLELVIVITMLSILWTFWFINYSENEINEYFDQYEEQVVSRVDNLYKKTLIWINWYYDNNWITEPDYIKLYCNQNDKTFYWYICDNTNTTSPNFNNCKQIDFPTLSNIKYWGVLSWYTKKIIEIDNCRYLDSWGNQYNNWSFYITINTKFPNWKVETFKENPLNTIDNILDDIVVDNVKVKVKDWSIVREFYPLDFN